MTQGRPAEIPAVERMVGPAPRPPEEPDTDGVPWRRLSPAMLAVHPVMETIRFLPVLVGVLFLGANGSGYLWSLIGLGIAIVLGLSRWFTTTYQVTPTHLRVRRGLFRRQAMSVPRDRIRSVDLTAHFLQRLLGLQRMVIGTGRSDRSDQGITLDALSREAAAQLRAELLHNKRPAAPKAATAATTAATTAANTATTTAAPKAVPPATYATPAESLIVALNPRWVRFGPFTLSGLATLGVVGGILSQVFNEADVSPDRFPGLSQVLGQLSALPLPVAVLEVIVTVAVVVAVLSTIGYLFVFWNFTLTRQGDTLHTQRGLISTRATTIEQRRLRGVELSEPLLLRLARGARCLAITTGLRVGHGAERGGSLLLPPAPAPVAVTVAAEVFGDATPFTCPLAGPGRGARRRRYTRALAAAAIVTGVLALLWWLAGWPAWGWQASLVLFPIGALLAEDRFRSLGYARLGRSLVFRQGSLVRRRYALADEGVIGWTIRESFFQRRRGLATLTATTAAGRQYYEGVDMDVAAAVRLADEVHPGLLTPFLVERES